MVLLQGESSEEHSQSFDGGWGNGPIHIGHEAIAMDMGMIGYDNSVHEDHWQEDSDSYGYHGGGGGGGGF